MTGGYLTQGIPVSEMLLVGSGGWVSGWCKAGSVGVVGDESPGAGSLVVPRVEGMAKSVPRITRRCRAGTVESSAMGRSPSIPARVFAASVELGSG
jgi:hypothetical protein